MDNISIFDLLSRAGFVISANLVRYFLIAGTFFLFFYVIRKKAWKSVKIQPRFPKKVMYWQEIKYSVLSMVIFACVGISIYVLRTMGYTQMYFKIEDYGWIYFFISIPIMLILHDTYFYWTHRAMHHPTLYKWVHKVHHHSHNPSPWAAFSFHPLEAIVEAGIGPLLVFIMPVHPIAFMLFLLVMTVMNAIGHLGYEIYPKGFQHHWFGKWNNCSTHHNMHHELVHYNYGLYFNWWDRWMKTNHPLYFARLEEVNQRREQLKELKEDAPLLQETQIL